MASPEAEAGWYLVGGVRYCVRCRTRLCERQEGGTLPCVLAETGTELAPNERGQWRRPPRPEDMARCIGAFVRRWTKYNDLKARFRGVHLVKSLWPDEVLIAAVEAKLIEARAAGAAGVEVDGWGLFEFCEQRIPRANWADNARRIMQGLAYRQWTIGRGELIKRLLREHRATLPETNPARVERMNARQLQRNLEALKRQR